MLKKDVEEVKKKLDKIGRESREIKIHVDKKVIKKGLEKISDILNKMLKEDVKDYTEVESKKAGDVKIERGLRIRFLDDKKKVKKWK